jgi:hypothetical protein
MSFFRIFAFIVNDTTGNIQYAPTQGIHQWAPRQMEVRPDYSGLYTAANPQRTGFYALFECGTAVLFNVQFPYELSNRVPINVAPIQWLARISPEDYYVQARKNVAVTCVPNDVEIGFLVRSEYITYPLGALANTTLENPLGFGYTFKAGQQISFLGAPLSYADDLQQVSSTYVNKLDEQNIIGAKEIIESRKQAQLFMDKAEEELSNLSYSGFFHYSSKAWTLAIESYVTSRNSFSDIISVQPYFALLLIPFTFLFERLILHLESGKKRLIALMILFFIFDALFSYMHPSFSLASNPLMVVIAFLVLILIFPAFYTLISYISRSIRKVKISTIGLHTVDVSRGSAAALAFQIGIENMKKRKLRSALTLITVILVVMGVTIFSSLSSISLVSVSSTAGTPPYEGLYIYDLEWRPLGKPVSDFIKGMYKDQVEVYINNWVYTKNRAESTSQEMFKVFHGDIEYRLYSLMATSSIEPYWLKSTNFTGSRWFKEGETNAIILPDIIFKALNVSVGDSVRLLDEDLLVLGSVEFLALTTIVDMNDQSILPIDWRDPIQPHASASQVAIIPYSLSLKLDPYLASIAVIPSNSSLVKPIAADVFNTLKEMFIISGVGNEISFLRRSGAVSVFGWEMQVVPLGIVGFMLFSLLYGSVKERERDIFIFSSVGLSPLHLAFMFLAESAIYAVVGGILGYLVSMSTYTILAAVVPSAVVGTLNYSSGFVVTALSSIMLLAILSSVIPAIKASSIATPSLERVWRIKTKPVENLWTIPVPVLVADDRDATGIIRYLKEYALTHEGEIGDFLAQKIKLKEEINNKEIEFIAKLAPYEMGIFHQAKVALSKDLTNNKWSILLKLQRIEGSHDTWVRLVQKFADDVRKQILVWKFLEEDMKKRYFQ